jgi:hypothetical protein
MSADAIIVPNLELGADQPGGELVIVDPRWVR